MYAVFRRHLNALTSSSTNRPAFTSPYRLFFFRAPATAAIYTLSLHDALPISPGSPPAPHSPEPQSHNVLSAWPRPRQRRSEEHTSELQSRQYLVCRLLLEKKKHRLGRQSS